METTAVPFTRFLARRAGTGKGILIHSLDLYRWYHGVWLPGEDAITSKGAQSAQGYSRIPRLTPWNFSEKTSEVGRLSTDGEIELLVDCGGSTVDCRTSILRKPSRSNLSNTTGPKTDLLTSGLLAGSPEEALADTCAGNFISEQYLQKHGLTFDSTIIRSVRRADKSSFNTLGTVSLPWKFKGEEQEHNVRFDVLDSAFCRHAVTLGGHFMSITQTLTKHTHRLLRRFRKIQAPRVFYQEGGHLRMTGYCEGLPVEALPDTCSDVSLLSLSFAKQLGKRIERQKRHQINLELPGDHIVQTSGLVRDVEWNFGNGEGDTIIRDFYVLDNLPADVLLGADFLEDTNAFESYSDDLLDYEELGIHPDEGLFLTIRWIGRARWWNRRKRKSEDHTVSMTMQNASSQNITDSPPPDDDDLQEWLSEESELLDRMEQVIRSQNDERLKNLKLDDLKLAHKALHLRRPPDKSKSTGSSSGPQARQTSPDPAQTS